MLQNNVQLRLSGNSSVGYIRFQLDRIIIDVDDTLVIVQLVSTILAMGKSSSVDSTFDSRSSSPV